MGLEFRREDQPKYGMPAEWSPLVTRVLCPNPSPFTYTGTGSFIIGRSDLAVIDPGPDNDEHLQALLRAIDGRPVTAILITHNHSDHSPLAVKLAQATGAPIMGPAIPEAIVKSFETGVKLDAGLDMSYRPDQIVIDGGKISGEGWTLQAIHTPGHVSHHISYHFLEEKSLFCGDHIMGWSTSVIIPPEGNLRDYLQSLKQLIAQDFKVFYPTHGLSINNPQKFMRATVLHRHMREGQIVACLKERPQTIAELVAVMYKAVDKALHGAAALSVMAHMIALIEDKRILADQSDLKHATFRLI